jgi:hypothetical protein
MFDQYTSEGKPCVIMGKHKGTPYDQVPSGYCDWVYNLGSFADKDFFKYVKNKKESVKPVITLFHVITNALIKADDKDHRFDIDTNDAWWVDRFEPNKALDYALKHMFIFETEITLSPEVRQDFVKNWKAIMTRCRKEMYGN